MLMSACANCAMGKPAAVSRYPIIVPPVRLAARWAFLNRQEDRTQGPGRVLTLGTRASRHERGDWRMQLHIIHLQPCNFWSLRRHEMSVARGASC
jgi:hypothetical protein